LNPVEPWYRHVIAISRVASVQKRNVGTDAVPVYQDFTYYQHPHPIFDGTKNFHLEYPMWNPDATEVRAGSWLLNKLTYRKPTPPPLTPFCEPLVFPANFILQVFTRPDGDIVYDGFGTVNWAWDDMVGYIGDGTGVNSVPPFDPCSVHVAPIYAPQSLWGDNLSISWDSPETGPGSGVTVAGNYPLAPAFSGWYISPLPGWNPDDFDSGILIYYP
jgi:hypothetical protein